MQIIPIDNGSMSSGLLGALSRPMLEQIEYHKPKITETAAHSTLACQKLNFTTGSISVDV
jgi:hypothetical protein